jgi:hypothetical protein
VVGKRLTHLHHSCGGEEHHLLLDSISIAERPRRLSGPVAYRLLARHYGIFELGINLNGFRGASEQVLGRRRCWKVGQTGEHDFSGR